jgi:hypothetical protein
MEPEKLSEALFWIVVGAFALAGMFSVIAGH